MRYLTSPDLDRPLRSAADMALDIARLALARIAAGDPQAMRLAKVALGDMDTLVPHKTEGRGRHERAKIL